MVPENGIKAIVELYSETDRSLLKLIDWNEMEEDSIPEGTNQKKSFYSLK